MIAYCNLALFMTNSTFNLTCADDGSVNEYVCMYVRMYVCTYVCMYVCMYVCIQAMQEPYWSRADVPVMKPELYNKDSDCEESDDVHNGPSLNVFV